MPLLLVGIRPNGPLALLRLKGNAFNVLLQQGSLVGMLLMGVGVVDEAARRLCLIVLEVGLGVVDEPGVLLISGSRLVAVHLGRRAIVLARGCMGGGMAAACAVGGVRVLAIS